MNTKTSPYVVAEYLCAPEEMAAYIAKALPGERSLSVHTILRLVSALGWG